MTSLDTFLASCADRCAHGYHVETQGCTDCGQRLKFEGMGRADAVASPDERSRIDAAIRQVAARGGTFSANDVRPLIHGAHGPLVGARFNAAAKAGLIVRVGYEPSTKDNTHGHPVATWKAAA